MKKFFAIFTAFFLMMFAAGCTQDSDSNKTQNNNPNVKKIGVAMPTQTSQRWIQDGDSMKEKLEAKGYAVDLKYAEDDIKRQVSQIENMIDSGVNCLVIASIDSVALVDVLNKAKKNNIPVIAYDRLLMDTDAISYYATFDNRGVGFLIGKYIEKKLELDKGKGPYNVEFFAGSPDDNNAYFVNSGVFDVLQPYIDKGQLKVPSGQTDFDLTCTLRWSTETAKKRMEGILLAHYKNEEKLDAVISPFDGISYGIIDALEEAGYKVGKDFPIITGQDAELKAVKNILSNKQSMTVFKDTRTLAEKCVTMVEAVLEGKEPEINDTTSCDNHKFVVPAYLCTPVVIDKNNVKTELIDSGYYTEDAINSVRQEVIFLIYKAAIFDMDGTLVNTLEDLADSVNEMLEHFNFPTRTIDEVRKFVGNGAKKLMERSLPAEFSADKNFVQKALEVYNDCYARHVENKSEPYDGIMDLLKTLQEKKIPLGICTNKQNFAAQIIAKKILSPIKFSEVIGDEPGKPRKPDPTRALEIAKKFSVQPSEVAYFGDTAVDMNTANNAGFLPIGVTWGFRPESELKESGAKIIIHHPKEIFEYINF